MKRGAGGRKKSQRGSLSEAEIIELISSGHTPGHKAGTKGKGGKGGKSQAKSPVSKGTGLRAVAKAIGDDTSVTSITPTRRVPEIDELVTTDTLVEGVHFTLDSTTPYYLGRKALSVSLSDIASMGGLIGGGLTEGGLAGGGPAEEHPGGGLTEGEMTSMNIMDGNPTHYLVSLGLPERCATKRFISDLYRGLRSAARDFGGVLLGGNVSGTGGRGSTKAKTGVKDSLFITTTVIGTVPREKALLRSTARVGDTIYATGNIGDSALGLRLLTKAGKEERKRLLKRRRGAVLRHINPAPRVLAGEALGREGLATAMTDISDGLLLDLKHICDASSVGGELYLDKIPISREILREVPRTWERVKLVLTGGEDYELLFTAPPGKAKRIEKLSKRVGLKITPIGKILPRSLARDRGAEFGILLIDCNGKEVRPPERYGFSHL